MKGKTVFCLLLLTALLCCACGGKQEEPGLSFGPEAEMTEVTQTAGLTLSVVDGQELKAGMSSLHLILHNATEGDIGFGRDFRVFMKSGNFWKEILWKDGATLPADYITVPPHQDHTLILELEALFGAPLNEGTYRVRKDVHQEGGHGKTALTVDFTVAP